MRVQAHSNLAVTLINHQRFTPDSGWCPPIVAGQRLASSTSCHGGDRLDLAGRCEQGVAGHLHRSQPCDPGLSGEFVDVSVPDPGFEQPAATPADPGTSAQSTPAVSPVQTSGTLLDVFA